MFQRKKVGLALGGGGARGLAHIGVLKVLEKNKIPIDYIAGTSIGAVIGALYASEQNAKKIEQDALKLEWKKLFDYTFPTKGFIKGSKIEKFLEEKLQKTEFKDLRIPLLITAYDLENHQEVVFNKGNVAKAVRASISIPGLFVPVENNNRILVDGGLVDPIPTEILKDKVDIIIAVNVDSIKEKKPILNETAVCKKGKKKIPNIINTAMKALQVINSQSAASDLVGDKVDFLINVNIPKMGIMDFDRKKAKRAIKIGERTTQNSLDELKRLTTRNPLRAFLSEIKEEFPIIKIVEKITK